MPITFSSLNVNGLNTKFKQFKLKDFALKYKTDIILLQEHNLKTGYDIEYIETIYDVYVNTTTILKGGVAILIRKNIGINEINSQYHHSSRLMHMTIKVNDIYFKILNVYGHSGPNLKNEREESFAEDMFFICKEI